MKVRLSLLLFSIIFSSVIQAKCLKVDLTVSGSLAEAIRGEEDITELIISGTMEAEDFLTITEDEYLVEHLALIDLSATTNLTTLPDNAFYGCSALTTVILPSDLTTIGNFAFGDCKSLSSISLPNSLTELGTYVFSGCKGLTDINIPEGITEIPNRAFEDCTSLTQIELPSTLEIIGIGAFGGVGLHSIILPEGLKRILNDAFYQSQLEEVTLPASLQELGINGFINCPLLRSVSVAPGSENFASKDGVLFSSDFKALLCYPAGKEASRYEVPSTVTSLGAFAFYSAFDNNAQPLHSYLTEIILPAGLTTIGEGAFAGCLKLKNISLPESVTNIGSTAFFSTGLEEIVIPEKVTIIEEGTFYSCKSLKEIILPTTLVSIKNDAFNECESLTTINIPNSVKEIKYGTFASCHALKEINIPKGLTYIDDNLFGSCKSLENIILPENIISIGALAFTDCSSLKKMVVPESVMTIYSSAFSQCTSLTHVKLPSTLNSLEDIFFGCTSLTSIILPETISNFNNIAFSGCSNLRSIYLYAPVPPETFDFDIDLPEDIIIYVPEASVDDYKNTPYWEVFDIRPLSTSGIASTENQGNKLFVQFLPEGNLQIDVPEKGTVEIYSLSGTLLHKQPIEKGENRIEEVKGHSSLIVSYIRKKGEKRESTIVIPSKSY